MIHLEMSMHDAVVLRHALFMYTKYHPEFFTCDRIKTIRKISAKLDKEIDREFEIKQSKHNVEAD